MKKLFTFILALAASAGTLFADSVKIGDLYYELSEASNTASVTYQALVTDEYAPINYPNLTTANIPSTVSYDGLTYNVTSIGGSAFKNCESLTSLIIPNSVTTICAYAFYGCGNLSDIVIPNSVTTIGNCAFYLVNLSNNSWQRNANIVLGKSITTIGLYGFFGMWHGSVICYSNTVPKLNDFAFDTGGYSAQEGENNGSFDATLYVLPSLVEDYKKAENWKDFATILPIAATPAETNEVNVTAEATTAEITWPQVVGAVTYEMIIRDGSNNVICTLIFNAEGQLANVVFYAPSKRALQQTQTAGFAFTVNGLTSGTTYNYSITAKDENGQVVNTETGTFTTTGEAPQGIDDVDAANASQKVFKDGQVLIQKGEKVYTVTGQEVK